MNANEAKSHYAHRHLSGLLNVVMVFVFGTLILAFFPNFWLLEIAFIGSLAYYYFIYLPAQTIRIDCSHQDCGNVVNSNTPWICGFCHKPNQNCFEFPFLNRCEHCNAEPKAYQCHHCGGLLFLTTDKMQDSYATALNSRFVKSTEEKGISQDDVKKTLRNEIEIAELTAKLEELKRRMTPTSASSPLEAMRTKFKRNEEMNMGLREIIKEAKLRYANQYKDDPESLERANDFVDRWGLDMLDSFD